MMKTMTDNEAIKWLNKNRPCISMTCNKENADNINIATDMAIEALENKRPQQGEWIKGKEISRTMIGPKVQHIEYKDYTCSNCGLVLDYLLYHFDGSPFYKFCPECGAEMRGG